MKVFSNRNKIKSKKFGYKEVAQVIKYYKWEIDMRVPAEIYKGIEYIRISSLPMDQKTHLYKSLNRKLIINILKDESLLNDCLQYQHYMAWYENIYKTAVEEKSIEVSAKSPIPTLVFK